MSNKSKANPTVGLDRGYSLTGPSAPTPEGLAFPRPVIGPTKITGKQKEALATTMRNAGIPEYRIRAILKRLSF